MKHLFTILVLFLSLIPQAGQSQCSGDTLMGVRGNYYVSVQDMHYTPDGGYYLYGIFGGDLYAGSITLSTPNAVDFHAFLIRYDRLHQVLWAKQFAGFLNNTLRDLEVDDRGNVYLTGGFGGSLSFDGNFVNSSPLSFATFVVRILGDGTVDWVRDMPGAGYHVADCDGQSGELVLAGVFQDSVILPSQTLLNPGNSDTYIFVSRWDSSGNGALLLSGGGLQNTNLGENIPSQIVSDGQGGAFLVGNHSLDAAFDGFSLPAQKEGGFVLHMDSLGRVSWLNPLSVPNASLLLAEGMDLTDQGNLMLTGSYWGNLELGDTVLSGLGTEYYQFFASWAPDGSRNWIKKLPFTQSQDYKVCEARWSPFSQEFVLAGTYSDFLLIGPSPLSHPNGNYGIFRAAFDEQGNYLNAQAGASDGTFMEDVSLGLGPNGQLALAGNFTRSLGIGSDSLNSSASDAFLWQTCSPSVNRDLPVESLGLQAYPNPVSGPLQLKWTARSGYGQISLYDLQGKLLRQISLNGHSGAAALDLSSLPQGSYLVRVQWGEQVASRIVLKR